jgi:hypothetical protein
MLDANVKIIEELKEFISIIVQKPDLLKQFGNSESDFSRSRKLPFERIVLLIVKLCKKTLSVELEQFFEGVNLQISCSVSAFTQQRMKLNPEFYRVWNELLYCRYYHYYGKEVKKWKGYRLIAADGSNVSLVKTPSLENHFGGQSNQHGTFVQAKTFYCFDVLNELVIRSEIAPFRTGELNMAYPLIDNLEDDMLMIYDRNFCSYKMVALHLWQEKEIKFVIRARETHKVVSSFIKSGKISDEVLLKPTDKAIKGLYQSGYVVTKNTLLKVRLIRVDLDQTVEVLMTNLWEIDGHLISEFKALYFKRWGVETNISRQKNILQLESFSGLKPISVEQDFYATIFVTNLFSILTKQAQNTIEATMVKRKYPMKINGNKSFGKLKGNIISLFVTEKPEIILEKLHQCFIRDPLPVRSNRSFPRIVKNKQSKSKHKTFMNYKPAY